MLFHWINGTGSRDLSISSIQYFFQIFAYKNPWPFFVVETSGRTFPWRGCSQSWSLAPDMLPSTSCASAFPRFFCWEMQMELYIETRYMYIFIYCRYTYIYIYIWICSIQSRASCHSHFHLVHENQVSNITFSPLRRSKVQSGLQSIKCENSRQSFVMVYLSHGCNIFILSALDKELEWPCQRARFEFYKGRISSSKNCSMVQHWWT